MTALDSRGPVQPITGSPIVNGAGVQSRVASPQPSPRPKAAHRGGWIWSGETEKRVTRFRRIVTVSEKPTSARAWISADVRYRMWINGKLASRGPADVGRDYESPAPGPWLDDARDLTRFFQIGKNVIAVEVFPEPLVYSEGTTGEPGFKIDIEIKSAKKTRYLFSDAQWKCSVAPDLVDYRGPNGYRADLRHEPVGWQTLDFDDKAWLAAKPVNSSNAATLDSILPEPLEAVIPPVGVTRVSPSVDAKPNGSAKISKDGGYSVRFGKILSAYVGLRVRGHAGATLLLTPNELDKPGYNRRAEIILRDGDQNVELPYMDSFSVINIEAKGVRSPIEILDVRAVFTSYPVQYRGSFECDSAEMNKLWSVCRWVTQICMQTHFLDSPHHQEPICDPGDYLIESQIAFYAFGDGALAKQDLRKFARILLQKHNANFHTSYALLWLQMLVQYVDYTGDTALAKELAPAVHSLLDTFATYVGKNGIISEAPNYMFCDWVEVEGFNLHHPPAVIGQAYMSAFYYRALADDSRIAALIGDKARVAANEAKRASLKSHFNAELWDDTAGLYRDGKPFQKSVKPGPWLPADRDISTHTTQGNILAAAYGLADQTRAKAIVSKVLARLDMNCQPYFMHFVFEALAANGLFADHAITQMRRWAIVPDTQSFHEMWTSGDLSHAWIATPLVQLSSRVLGVRPTRPGFKTWLLDPQPCGLKWAKGCVPTPRGDISVEWRLGPNGGKVTFTVPNGTKAQFRGRSYSPGKHSVGAQFER